VTTRRAWRILGVLAAATLAASPPPPAAADVAAAAAASDVVPTRPLNILFLLTDDQRWDALGVAGNRILRTPHLDRLARQGVLFTNNFETTPVCYASRASIYTGQYNRRHRVDGFEDSFTPDALAATYPLILRRAGYHTGFIGKWGIGGELPAAEFDDWQGFAGQGSYFEPREPEHLTARQGHQAAAFVRTAPEPFQLTVAFKAPHVQDGDCSCEMPPDPADLHLYDDVTIPMARTATEAAWLRLPEFLRHSEGRNRWQHQFATAEMGQKSLKDYYRLITGMDRAVGEIVAALERRGVADRTLVVFTSDNGMLLGEHGLTGKWLMYEESIRTPLIVYWPGLPPARRGGRAGQLVLNVDLAPTMLDAAGLRAPASMQGRSLRPLVFGQQVPWRGEWFFEHHLVFAGIPKSEGVRRPRWKYVRYVEQSPVYEQLFDLDADPYEEQDVLHTPEVYDRQPALYAKQLQFMRARWQALREAVR
jgi:arylsulfatase A-like enzyme